MQFVDVVSLVVRTSKYSKIRREVLKDESNVDSIPVVSCVGLSTLIDRERVDQLFCHKSKQGESVRIKNAPDSLQFFLTNYYELLIWEKFSDEYYWAKNYLCKYNEVFEVKKILRGFMILKSGAFYYDDINLKYSEYRRNGVDPDFIFEEFELEDVDATSVSILKHGPVTKLENWHFELGKKHIDNLHNSSFKLIAIYKNIISMRGEAGIHHCLYACRRFDFIFDDVRKNWKVPTKKRKKSLHKQTILKSICDVELGSLPEIMDIRPSPKNFSLFSIDIPEDLNSPTPDDKELEMLKSWGYDKGDNMRTSSYSPTPPVSKSDSSIYLRTKSLSIGRQKDYM